jgi:hypothetical protein
LEAQTAQGSPLLAGREGDVEGRHAQLACGGGSGEVEGRKTGRRQPKGGGSVGCMKAFF